MKCHINNFVVALFLLVISNNDVKVKAQANLNEALTFAGNNNKKELLTVLEYYKNDSLKLKSAKFLIENMNGFFSYNNKIKKICQPFYEDYDSIAKVNNYDLKLIGEKINKGWDDFSNKNLLIYQLPDMPDIENIKANQLIFEIDLAFKAWKENVYTRNSSFEDFCEYILPYRRANGLVMDNSRQVFYERNHGTYFTKAGKDMIEEADSLLHKYSYIKYSKQYGENIPILDATTLEKLCFATCDARCWYNSLLFSSLGMAVAIDFIPAWGNKNNAHVWNVLIKDGKSYAFDPFWVPDRWEYKKTYTNESFDLTWGRSRLPKVFRNTYKNYFEGPGIDKRVSKEDVPDLFMNFRKKDVSHEYFKTVNVTIKLKNIPEKTYYAYLCVFNNGEWKPVQWGEIENGIVTFHAMGKDIIYMACYYKSRNIIYADEPFLLNNEGLVRYFNTDKSLTESLYIKNCIAGSTLHYRNLLDHIRVAKSVLLGSNTMDFNNSDTICIFPEKVDIYHNEVRVNFNKAIRYIRIKMPYKVFAYSDLSFFGKSNKGKGKIKSISLVHPLDSTSNGETTGYIFDKYCQTGYKKEIPEGYIDLDLGKEYKISTIQYTPYFLSYLDDKCNYNLFYWQKGWQFIGTKKGSRKHIVFENVPKNSLLLLKNKDKVVDINSRPFIYENNEVFWY